MDTMINAPRTKPRQSAKSQDEKKYRVYNLKNYKRLPQIEQLPDEQLFEMDVVGHVLPFKCNNYVAEALINWDDVPNDPIFTLTFPQRGMLKDKHFHQMAEALKGGADRKTLKEVATNIRLELNPHPAGQAMNVPEIDGVKLTGVQHKYRETALFFPSQGQTCHAYCSFCFRWPQFVGMNELKFAMRETELLVKYLQENPQITDVLFTGGDPMIMKTKIWKSYIEALLEADLPNLQTIRIGTKVLSYWPYKFIADSDADEMLRLMERVSESGKHLAIMAHFNHPRELQTDAAREAIRRIQNTGAVIRTQSPLLKNINADASTWADMWREQVRLGIVPYYMFVVRDTGAQHYFEVPLVRAWETYREAYQQVSGLGRTVRGPSMSADPGKVCVMGPTEVHGEKVLGLTMLQGRNPEWTNRPFFAKYDEKAMWLDDLKPAFGEDKFFFQDELEAMYEKDSAAASVVKKDC